MKACARLWFLGALIAAFVVLSSGCASTNLEGREERRDDIHDLHVVAEFPESANVNYEIVKITQRTESGCSLATIFAEEFARVFPESDVECVSGYDDTSAALAPAVFVCLNGYAGRIATPGTRGVPFVRNILEVEIRKGASSLAGTVKVIGPLDAGPGEMCREAVKYLREN
jgi:hypothetical protein